MLNKNKETKMDKEIKTKKLSKPCLIKNLSKRIEMNRSISLNESNNSKSPVDSKNIPPAKSLDNKYLTNTSKKLVFNRLKLNSLQQNKKNKPVKNTINYQSLEHENLNINQKNYTPFLFYSLSNLTMSSNKITNKCNSNLLSLRIRSLSDCSNCLLNSNLYLNYKAQINFLKTIQCDLKFIDSIDKINVDLCDNLIEKKNKKLNIEDVVKKFRKKHEQIFIDQSKHNKIKTPAICVDEYLFSWVPPGLNNEEVKKYFIELPLELVPLVGSLGDLYRDKQLIYQLPIHDLNIYSTKFQDKSCISKYEKFVIKRNQALDVAYVQSNLQYDSKCAQCLQLLIKGSIVVTCPRLVCRNNNFHPYCFRCCVCFNLLVDLIYCVYNKQVYCERHFAEQFQKRCRACDEIDEAWTDSMRICLVWCYCIIVTYFTHKVI